MKPLSFDEKAAVAAFINAAVSSDKLTAWEKRKVYNRMCRELCRGVLWVQPSSNRAERRKYGKAIGANAYYMMGGDGFGFGLYAKILRLRYCEARNE